MPLINNFILLGSDKAEKSCDHDSEPKSKSEGHARIEKQQSSPVFGALDVETPLLHHHHHEHIGQNGISGACSSGNICTTEKQAALKKSHSTSYNKIQGSNVMGRIKDRTGVPV